MKGVPVGRLRLCCNLLHCLCQNNPLWPEGEEDKEKEGDDNKKRFKAPTVEDVAAYCKERQNDVDAENFVDYYSARDWKLGKNKMKDWRAAVRTWERNGYSSKSLRAASCRQY